MKLTEKIREIEASLAEGNRIQKIDSDRKEIERHENEDIELLKLFDHYYSELRAIIGDFMKRRS